MNINERSSKADIIDAAVELTSLQAEEISELKQRQVILLSLIGVLVVLQLL